MAAEMSDYRGSSSEFEAIRPGERWMMTGKVKVVILPFVMVWNIEIDGQAFFTCGEVPLFGTLWAL